MKKVKENSTKLEKININQEEVIALTKRDFFNSLLATSLLLNFLAFTSFVALTAKGLI